MEQSAYFTVYEMLVEFGITSEDAFELLDQIQHDAVTDFLVAKLVMR